MAAKDTYLPLLCSELSINLSNISTKLHIYDATTNLSTANLSANSTHHLSTATSAVQTSSPNPIQMTSENPRSRFIQLAVKITTAEFRNWVYSKPKFSELFKPFEPNQKQPLTNIPPATVIEDESLAAIFPFEIEELTETSLFSGATLKEKPIMAMYTDAKINDSGSTGSIITRQLIDQLADGATKTPIGEIDNLLIEINDITVPIKVMTGCPKSMQHLTGTPKSSSLARMDDTHVYQPHVVILNPSPCYQLYLLNWKKKRRNLLGKPIKFSGPIKTITTNYHQYYPKMIREKKQTEELIWNLNQAWGTDNNQNELPTTWE
ncbi:hypothetical protein G9A89_005846 [Geosiphon pyriformis]|nr:hypothetical protein G9A89_005846 [Geosiphon pyriformis]